MNTEYTNFYFEVRDERGKLQATFQRLWEAEKYIEESYRQEWQIIKVLL